MRAGLADASRDALGGVPSRPDLRRVARVARLPILSVTVCRFSGNLLHNLQYRRNYGELRKKNAGQ